jgi:hypothetical protein
MPVCRFNDGSYHVEGDLVLASKERQFFNFKNVLLILKTLGGKNVIFVSPMPRLLYEQCCGDDNHTTNRLDLEYEEELRRNLNECGCNNKSFLFSNQVKARVIDPSPPVLPHHDVDGEDIRGGDPVYPLPQGYCAILDLLTAKFSSFNTGSKKRLNMEGGGSLSKKPKEAQRRQRGWRRTPPLPSPMSGAHAVESGEEVEVSSEAIVVPTGDVAASVSGAASSNAV